MNTRTRKAILGPMRLNFLLLTPACVALGLAAVRWRGLAIDWVQFGLVLAGALAAHIAVNALNEYADFRSGLDRKTTRTPFSGGSGTLPALPDKAPFALATGVIALVLVAAVGIYFVVARGLGLLPLGLLGMLIIATYTPRLTRYWLLCLVAPGLGFGPLMVMGTEFCLAGSYSWTGAIVSMTPFFLVNNLLLLNQLPDLEPDRSVGRRHLIITAGAQRGVAVYGLFLIGAYLAPVAGWLLGALPIGALLGLVTAPLAISTFRAVRTGHGDLERLMPSLGKNVVLNLATPVLIAMGMIFGTR
jgi:1,4-dihydroxy-2-naphthoate polyprenyltransferase